MKQHRQRHIIKQLKQQNKKHNKTIKNKIQGTIKNKTTQ